ncbi:MAG: FHA domain-containing protein [Candidatus Hydrogenedentes bacterium]|nr:FHA domain-containing protein [Candidatus Hydrogenedentota bacterium]
MSSGRCSKCDAAFGKGAKFCKRCGESLLAGDPAGGGVEVLTDAALDEIEKSPGESRESVSEAPNPSPDMHGDLFDSAEVSPSPETRKTGSITITVRNGLAAGRALRVPESATLVVGAAADADLTLNDECVSRKHAALRVDSGRLFVEDLGSSNGTFVRVTTARELHPNDILVLGNTLLQVGRE